MHRVANRLGWTSPPTADPEATRKALEGWVPREVWGELNVLFVGFGQQVCTPVSPHCGVCLARGVCPVGLGLKSPGSSPARKAVKQ